MRLSGYQPQYFPRLHYFARILDSDIFEISDYLQFVKKHAYPLPDGSMERGKSYQAHTPIKLHQGIAYLSLPIKRKGLLPICQTEIDYGQQWVKKHLSSIRAGYSKARFFKTIFPEIESILLTEYENLAQLNIKTILWGIARILDEKSVDIGSLSTDFINQRLGQNHHFRLQKILVLSETDIAPPGGNRNANDWIIEICQKYAADEYYYGGTSASAYMDFDKFRNAKISLVEQAWNCPKYPQQFPKLGFLPNLSIIDLLMNEDLAKVQSILLGNRDSQ